jgi:hypothetical protein
MSLDVLSLDYRFYGIAKPPAVASAAGGPWCSKITAGGSPTISSALGLMSLALDSTVEIQNLCLYWGDDLALTIGQIVSLDIWASVSAALNGVITASFGLASARNDAIASISQYLLFQLNGNNNLSALSKDGSHNVAATATGLTLSTTIRRFSFDLASGVLTQSAPNLSLGGSANVRVAAENSQGLARTVLASTPVNMSGYTGGLQPFFQLQKTSNAAVGTLNLQRMLIRYKQN